MVDYFLFDLKRGYCDYLASAMVVLSRLAGIPARLATGMGALTQFVRAALLPQLPRLAHHALNENRLAQLEAGLTFMLRQQQTRNRWLAALTIRRARKT